MTLWVVKGGQKGQREDRFIANSIVGIGWEDIGDLSAYHSRDALKLRYEGVYPADSPGRRAVQVGQLWAFANDMAIGDLVVTPLKTRPEIAVGRVASPYEFTDKFGTDLHHVRHVTWARTDLPRPSFDQDLLYSFGAFMSVCTVHRNNAESRVEAMLTQPTAVAALPTVLAVPTLPDPDTVAERDIEQDAREQITELIATKYKGHALARLVDGVLRAQGFVTRVSPPGPDGGVDILAAAGTMGFDRPRVAVQVKSGAGASGAEVLRTLKGTMSDFGADQGLLVSWGGFSPTLQSEARTGYFRIRLWNQTDLVDAILENYEAVDSEFKADLPLKRVWALARQALDDQ
jgi:restriction system protein